MNSIRRKSTPVGFLILILLYLTSCASHKSASKIDIKEDPNKNIVEETVAVFPVFIGKSCQFIPRVGNFALTAGERIVTTLKNDQPRLKILTPQQVNLILMENELSENFSNINKLYKSSGKVDINLVKEIVRPFEVQYFLFAAIDSLTGSESITYKPQADAVMSAYLYDVNSSLIVQNVSIKEQEIVVRVLGSYPYERATLRACGSLMNALFSDSGRNAPITSKICLGLLVGSNYSKIHTDEKFLKPKPESGLIVAGSGQFHLKGPFYIQADVQYVKKNAFFKPTNTEDKTIKWFYNFIDIPLMIQVKPTPRINKWSQYFALGTSFCFNQKYSTKIMSHSIENYSIIENRNKPLLDITLVMGTGFEYSYNQHLKFSSNLQYFWSLYSLHKYDTWKLRTFKLMAGFLFYI